MSSTASRPVANGQSTITRRRLGLLAASRNATEPPSDSPITTERWSGARSLQPVPGGLSVDLLMETQRGGQSLLTARRAKIDREQSEAGRAEEAGIPPHAVMSPAVPMEQEQGHRPPPRQVPGAQSIAPIDRDRHRLRLVVEIAGPTQIPRSGWIEERATPLRPAPPPTRVRRPRRGRNPELEGHPASAPQAPTLRPRWPT